MQRGAFCVVKDVDVGMRPHQELHPLLVACRCRYVEHRPACSVVKPFFQISLAARRQGCVSFIIVHLAQQSPEQPLARRAIPGNVRSNQTLGVRQENDENEENERGRRRRDEGVPTTAIADRWCVR